MHRPVPWAKAVCFIMLESRRISLGSKTEQICAVFTACFTGSHRAALISGGEEPFYQPAASDREFHQIVFRADYAASALHEVAHWCIAGEARRQRPDYGYWYEPDGRNRESQGIFERVEVRPQALECLFSLAAAMPFQVSVDNLGGEEIDPFPFQLAVWQQVQVYLHGGLPPRGEQFRRALAAHFGTELALTTLEVPLKYIAKF